MTRLTLIGLVPNESQLIAYETVKDDEKIVLLLVDEKYEMKFENYVVAQNVTRDFSICLGHNSLILRQIATKLWSFYLLIVVNYWLKYQSQKTCLSRERGKISSICHARFYSGILSREIIMYITIPHSKQTMFYILSYLKNYPYNNVLNFENQTFFAYTKLYDHYLT